MLGVGIWVTTQETEYKHLAGNMVSLIYFHAAGKGIKIWVKQCFTRICRDRLGTPVLFEQLRGRVNQLNSK